MWRYAERCREVERHGSADWAVLHPLVVDKNGEEYIGREGSQPQNRPSIPGFQCQEDKSP